MKWIMGIAIRGPVKSVLKYLLVVFGAWATEKVFDAVFSISLASIVWGYLKALWAWLGEEVLIPPYPLVVLGVALIVVLVLAFRSKRATSKAVAVLQGELNAVRAKLSEIQNPPVPPLPKLSATEHSVIMAIAAFLDNEHFPDERDLRNYLQLTPNVTQLALDGLHSKRLVADQFDTNLDTFIDLTEKGRIYALHPESLARETS
jgi:DNA-binding MarR family transcriptional regulator